MKAGDFLAKLAAKSGIILSDEKYKDLSTSLAALTAEIPEDAVAKISGALMNMDDARNNGDLKKHFVAAVFDGGDSEINRVMDEMGFEVADREYVKSSETFFKKIGALTRKVKELEQKKNESGKGEKSDLQKQINERIAEIAALKKSFDDREKQLKSEFDQKLTTTQIKSILNGKKYANVDIPQDVNVETAIVLINRKLEESGAKVVNQNGTLSLKQAKDETLDWISPTNEKLSVEQFFDGALAQSKLIAVTNADQAKPAAGSFEMPPIIQGGGGNVPNADFMAEINAAMNEAQAAVR